MSLPLPAEFTAWFTRQGWSLRAYQQDMLDRAETEQSTLLIAPTGAGKTLSGFLPSLVDLQHETAEYLHTLYISPLKALTQDIHRNLLRPIEEMDLPITVETRTGDTPSHKRQRQRKRPPHILLTTPESLMLMLSYADAPKIFGKLKTVIIDEVHSLIGNKRGDFTTLALARLESLAPGFRRIGLSATVAKSKLVADWLGPTGEPAALLEVEDTAIATLKFKNGALGIIEATTATRPKDLEGSISILGEMGSVVVGGFAVNELQSWNFEDADENDVDVLNRYSVNPPDVYGFGHQAYYEHVVNCIRSDGQNLVDGFQGRKSVELISAIYESIETGEEVFLRFKPKRCKLGQS